MKTKILLALSACICIAIFSFGQRPTMEFTFTAIDSVTYVQLDSIKVMNRTQGGDTVLYYPDTVLVLDYVVKLPEYNALTSFQLSQNYPNPVIDKTIFSLSVPDKGKVLIIVTDILGRQVVNKKVILDKGVHSFSFQPGAGQLHFITALLKGQSKSIKVISSGLSQGNHCSLEYLGSGGNEITIKSTPAIQGWSYNIGDELLYIGNFDTLQSGMLDVPETSETYIFQFATNIPCPGTPTVTYEGQVYNTIQIFSQCWMKENLNVGIMIQSTQPQINNDTIEKYCMSDNEYHCNNFAGGLYFLDEMMKYTNEPGGQGICPEGWHIPDDLDWQVLEGAVDSEYKIGDPEWGSYVWRGTDAGGNLKQTGTTNWEPPNTGATDAFGFTALPGGYFVQNAFWGSGYKGIFWSSDIAMKYYRNMDWNQAMIKKGPGSGDPAFSVRCIKD